MESINGNYIKTRISSRSTPHTQTPKQLNDRIEVSYPSLWYFLFVFVKRCMTVAQRVYTFTHRLATELPETFCMLYACVHRYSFSAGLRFLSCCSIPAVSVVFPFCFTDHCPYYLENTVSKHYCPFYLGITITRYGRKFCRGPTMSPRKDRCFSTMRRPQKVLWIFNRAS